VIVLLLPLEVEAYLYYPPLPLKPKLVMDGRIPIVDLHQGRLLTPLEGAKLRGQEGREGLPQ